MNNFDANNYYLPPLANVRNSMVIGAARVLTGSLTMLIYATLSLDVITDFQGLAAYSMLLIGYLSVEMMNIWARDKHLFWINPVVLASAFTFVMAFGVSNLLFFLPEDVVALVGLRPIATPWMNKLMSLVIMGAIAMWVGYFSGMGRGMASQLQRSRVLRKWMSPTVRVRKPVVYACVAVGLAAKLWSVSLGLYGYSSSYAQLTDAASYTQYLAMADALGKLAMAVVALQCFSTPQPSLADRQFLWLIVGYEVAFGFLSGFKGAVVMPFVMVGVVHYSQRNRFPRWLIPAIAFSLMAAYAVIEPFRAARNDDPGFSGISVGGIVSTIISAGSVKVDDPEERASTVLTLLARSNLTYVASLGIEYAANNNELPAGSPAFLGDIFLAPVHAFIPRFIWEDKSLQNTGLWYTNEVLGLDLFSATGMSPITYLNFAGGPLAVILGFLVLGIVQRGLFDGLRHFGAGGLIVLFGLLATLVNIDNAFNSLFVSLIRFLPMLVVVQAVMLRGADK